MRDLTESSRLFEASSRLQSAATAVAKLQASQALNDVDRENLGWAGQFLSEVDSTTNPEGVGGITGDLAVQATDVRPSFYAALVNVEPALKGEGIEADSELQDFLSATYQYLESAGATANLQSGGRIHLAQVLLEELAKALLIRLTGNGVPLEGETQLLLTA